MNNNIFRKLLMIIKEEEEGFNTIVETDNLLGLNVTSEEILNYLEFTETSRVLKGPIVGNIIITEGDVLSTLKVIHDLESLEGNYVLYINGDNVGIITYLVDRVNKVYKELGLNIVINIDVSDNYNRYLNELVTIVGSENFLNTVAKDFPTSNRILV